MFIVQRAECRNEGANGLITVLFIGEFLIKGNLLNPQRFLTSRFRRSTTCQNLFYNKSQIMCECFYANKTDVSINDAIEKLYKFSVFYLQNFVKLL